tara:strand:+ start:212 stop:370 length:159 start_codon:yes stop_codon:yes gene_type:complete
MYNSTFQIKDNLTVEVIEHNATVIISNEHNKIRFIGYTIEQAINNFKNEGSK